MSNCILLKVLSVESDGILRFMVEAPNIPLDIPGQTSLDEFHITLARLDDMCISMAEVILPPPPSHVLLKYETFLISNDEKQKKSCVAYVENQEDIQAYVKICSDTLDYNIVEPNRKFHVTLSNAGGGDPRASIGDVWDFPHEKISLPELPAIESNFRI